MKNVTLKEVAKEAGVSVMSVSKALNNKEGLSDETRRRILEIAAQMNYSQNQVACSLRTGATRTIGVVLSDSAESVVARVLRGIQDEARRNGYSVIITNTDKQPELEYDAIQSLIDKRIDGLILVAPEMLYRGAAHVDPGLRHSDRDRHASWRARPESRRRRPEQQL